MNRRHFLGGIPALALAPAARADEQPWAMEFLAGRFDGAQWHAGFRVSLLPGWKTYWRIPGSAGIAPDISVTGANLKSMQMFYPLPQRLKAGDDDLIGYVDEVVFPLLLEPGDAAKPLDLTYKAFLGVCDLVCIPARAEGRIVIKPVGQPPLAAAQIEAWRERVPKPSQGIVTAATAGAGASGKPEVRLVFSQPVMDVFAESERQHYFEPPLISGLEARMAVADARAAGDLKGSTLRLTLALKQGGVEETVTLV